MHGFTQQQQEELRQILQEEFKKFFIVKVTGIHYTDDLPKQEKHDHIADALQRINEKRAGAPGHYRPKQNGIL